MRRKNSKSIGCSREEAKEPQGQDEEQEEVVVARKLR